MLKKLFNSIFKKQEEVEIKKQEIIDVTFKVAKVEKKEVDEVAEYFKNLNKNKQFNQDSQIETRNKKVKYGSYNEFLENRV